MGRVGAEAEAINEAMRVAEAEKEAVTAAILEQEQVLVLGVVV